MATFQGNGLAIESSAIGSAIGRRAGRGASVIKLVTVAGLAALLLVLGGCAPAAVAPSARDIRPLSVPPVSAPPVAPSAEPSVTPAPPAPPPAVGQPPATVTIPAMELSEPLIDLAIDAEGAMEVPRDFGDVGWFTGGGRPGGVGPTVIAGHVDSSAGPAVFFRLRDLVPGDLVQVTDVAGQTFDYEVYRVGDYPKAEFPTAEVFGATLEDELRLITCTGLFDRSVGHYEDNRVVFAKRA